MLMQNPRTETQSLNEYDAGLQRVNAAERMSSKTAEPSPDDRTLPTVLELRCAVQHYSWGDPRFIPELLGLENPARQPFAELWMGAHPDAPSEAVLETGVVALGELIRENAGRILHPRVA